MGVSARKAINSYCSAISMTHAAIDGVVVGKHPLVSRLMKGIYNQRPPKARYPFYLGCQGGVGSHQVVGTNSRSAPKDIDT